MPWGPAFGSYVLWIGSHVSNATGDAPSGMSALSTMYAWLASSIAPLSESNRPLRARSSSSHCHPRYPGGHVAHCVGSVRPNALELRPAGHAAVHARLSRPAVAPYLSRHLDRARARATRAEDEKKKRRSTDRPGGQSLQSSTVRAPMTSL